MTQRQRKPIIGITPTDATKTYGDDTTFRIYGGDEPITRSVIAAGGVPLFITPWDADVDDILDAVDGLLITGGDDIDPARYGDEAHPRTTGVDALRDELEIGLARRALERGVPMLCICRGNQLLNVAMGGTLVQDIPSLYPTEISHSQNEAETSAAEPQHTVAVTPGSLLERTYEAETIAVNSFHHQALRDLAPGLIVNAVAPDELVEGVELERAGAAWTLGIQWHPEYMWQAHPEHLRPFTALVEESRRRAAAPG